MKKDMEKSLRVHASKKGIRSVILHGKRYGCTCSFQNNIAIKKYFTEKDMAVIIYL